MQFISIIQQITDGNWLVLQKFMANKTSAGCTTNHQVLQKRQLAQLQTLFGSKLNVQSLMLQKFRFGSN